MEIPETVFKTLKTLSEYFVEQKISYQITGGLAACIYGAERPLYDIDIEIDAKDMAAVRDGLRQYVAKDIHHFQDDNFDLFMMTLDIDGIPVDISQTEPILHRLTGGEWQRLDARLDNANLMDVGGLQLPVVAKADLLRYKSIVKRSTDIDDIRQIRGENNA